VHDILEYTIYLTCTGKMTVDNKNKMIEKIILANEAAFSLSISNFFNETCIPIIAKRNSMLVSPERIRINFFSNVLTSIRDYPEHFNFNKDTENIIRLFHCLCFGEKTNKFVGPFKFTDASDALLVNYYESFVVDSRNKINEIGDLKNCIYDGDSDLKDKGIKNCRSLVYVLSKYYNVKKGNFEIKIPELLDIEHNKTLKKRNEYFEIIRKGFSNKNINKILSKNKFEYPKDEVKSINKRNLPGIINKNIHQSFYSQMFSYSYTNDLCNDQYIFEYFHNSSLIFLTTSNLHEDIINSKFPFLMTISELNSVVKESLIKEGISLINKSGRVYNKEFRQKERVFNRMAISHKTRNALKDATHSEIYLSNLNFYNYDSSNLIPVREIYIRLNLLQVNQGYIRFIVKQIYPPLNKLISFESELFVHDLLGSVHTRLESFLKKLEGGKLNKISINKIFSLIASEVGSKGELSLHSHLHGIGVINTYDLRRNEYSNFNNMDEFYSHYLNYGNKKLVEKIKTKLTEKSVHYDPLSIEILSNMLLHKSILKLIDGLPDDLGSINTKKKYVMKLGPFLTVSIEPRNTLKGMLGAGVPGVCIRHGESDHISHYHEECSNLIIHDDKKIYMWGLLVKGELENLEERRECYFLNNFQGGLPSRYQKYLHDVKESVHALMNDFGEVYSVNQYFNCLQLFDDNTHPIIYGKLLLPNLRLDIQMYSLDDDKKPFIFNERTDIYHLK